MGGGKKGGGSARKARVLKDVQEALTPYDSWGYANYD